MEDQFLDKALNNPTCQSFDHTPQNRRQPLNSLPDRFAGPAPDEEVKLLQTYEIDR